MIEEEVGDFALFKLSLLQTVYENITSFYKDCLFHLSEPYLEPFIYTLGEHPKAPLALGKLKLPKTWQKL